MGLLDEYLLTAITFFPLAVGLGLAAGAGVVRLAAGGGGGLEDEYFEGLHVYRYHLDRRRPELGDALARHG